MSDLSHEDVYGKGNTAETATTNLMAQRPGYPARTVDGDLVNIVKKEARAEGGTMLVDEDGKTWIVRDTDSVLIPTNGHGQMADEYVDQPLPTNEANDADIADGRAKEGRSPERDAA